MHCKTSYRIPGLIKNLNRLGVRRAHVPQADGGVHAGGDDQVLGDGVVLVLNGVARKENGVDTARVGVCYGGGAEASDGLCSRYVPEENSAVAAGGDEVSVGAGDGNGKDGVGVGGVCLDRG
jgi:hypothetical protein